MKFTFGRGHSQNYSPEDRRMMEVVGDDKEFLRRKREARMTDFCLKFWLCLLLILVMAGIVSLVLLREFKVGDGSSGLIPDAGSHMEGQDWNNDDNVTSSALVKVNISSVGPCEFYCGWNSNVDNSSSEFIIDNESEECISMSLVCDNQNDCSNGRDEKHCIKLATSSEISRVETFTEFEGSSPSSPHGFVCVNVNQTWQLYCTIDWSTDMANAICQYLGYQKAGALNAFTFTVVEDLSTIPASTSSMPNQLNMNEPYWESELAEEADGQTADISSIGVSTSINSSVFDNYEKVNGEEVSGECEFIAHISCV